jgi:flagella basal body P-ring formation protein FlgA
VTGHLPGAAEAFTLAAMPIFLLLLFLALSSTPAPAAWQDLDTLRTAILQYARQQTAQLPGRVEIEAGAIDPRLHLAQCSTPEVFLPPGNRLWGRTTLGVRCRQDTSWVIYAPLTVKVQAKIVATARPLPRGQTLTETDLRLVPADLTQVPAGVYTEIKDVLSNVTTTGLAAGIPLQSSMLRPPYVIRAGQTVQLLYEGNGFKVNSEGKALAHAAAGELVQVRVASGKVLRGIARSGGIVEVK